MEAVKLQLTTHMASISTSQSIRLSSLGHPAPGQAQLEGRTQTRWLGMLGMLGTLPRRCVEMGRICTWHTKQGHPHNTLTLLDRWNLSLVVKNFQWGGEGKRTLKRIPWLDRFGQDTPQICLTSLSEHSCRMNYNTRIQ